jgi:hypothetical protein
MLRFRYACALLTGCALIVLTAGAAVAADFTPGSFGLGDPFFPNGGNGGYDVANYDLKLSYDPATDVLDGKATVTARATQNLSRFDLDLRGFEISRLTVNGGCRVVCARRPGARDHARRESGAARLSAWPSTTAVSRR